MHENIKNDIPFSPDIQLFKKQNQNITAVFSKTKSLHIYDLESKELKSLEIENAIKSFFYSDDLNLLFLLISVS